MAPAASNLYVAFGLMMITVERCGIMPINSIGNVMITNLTVMRNLVNLSGKFNVVRIFISDSNVQKWITKLYNYKFSVNDSLPIQIEVFQGM